MEFGLNGIPFKQQPRFNVIYKSVRVSEYFPDLIVFDRIVTAAGTSFAGRSSAKANFRAWKAASPSPGSRASLRISSGLLLRDFVDTKTIDRITDLERGQILNYLKITQLRVGLILNFKRPKA